MAAVVSVVIPTFNNASFIEQAVRSMLEQTHSNVEVVVVDDGSTDETRSIVGSIRDPRLTLVAQENRGCGAARNAGLREVSGEFVAFLDGDDYWFPHKLERHLTVFAGEPRVVALGSLMRHESKDGRVVGVAGERVGRRGQRRIASGAFTPFPISSALFRREAVERAGGFEEAFGSERVLLTDKIMLAGIAREGEVRTLMEVLGAYRIHGNSATRRATATLRMQGRFVRARLAAEKSGVQLTWEEFSASYRPTFPQRYSDRVRAWYRRAGGHAAEGRWGRALGLLLLTLAVAPHYAGRRLLRQQLNRLRSRSPSFG